jgi:hypothetical protein
LTRLEGPDAEEHNGRLRRQWRNFVELPAQEAGKKAPQLVLSQSPYRSFVGRLLRAVQQIEARFPDRPILVVIPALIKLHWWDYVLATRRAHRLCEVLVRHGGPDLAVVIVPWAREAPVQRKSSRRRSLIRARFGAHSVPSQWRNRVKGREPPVCEPTSVDKGAAASGSTIGRGQPSC